MPFKRYAARRTAALLLCASLPSTMLADSTDRPDSHAPIGVMADHTHQRGEWMFSYRFMHMAMASNRRGTDDLSAAEIATTVPNRFFGRPMQPPTLRVVPTRMTMDMHMLGLMYAPSDRLTLMAMLPFIDKEMDHITFAGASGTDVLGRFTTRSKGLGDSRIAGLIKLGSNDDYRFHMTLGLSLPTGDLEQTDQVLAPNGLRPTLRLPYPMQLGSGSYELITGLTFAEATGRVGWGSQWQSIVRVADNDEDYRFGDEHRLSAWASYRWLPRLSVSARLAYLHRDNIEGADRLIVAPVQTADPSNQGVDRLDLSIGANMLLPWGRQRLAFELGLPIYQDLDGPQLEADWHLSLGYQLSF